MTESAEPDVRAATASSESQKLNEVLGEARLMGFLGPAPVSEQVQRSLAFAELAGAGPQLAVDLGSGGGIPALVLASIWPSSRWVLVESSERRANWLVEALSRLRLADRCRVLCRRAETIGRDNAGGALRHSADLVTSRSFAPPGPTAECAAPLLRLGGQLLVSCPPGTGEERWPATSLAMLGLALEEVKPVQTPAGPLTIARLECRSLSLDAFPRRAAFKRPLF